MRSKSVHRTWAHQGGDQGQGTRLPEGPPICPRTTRQARHRQPRQRTGGPPGSPQPGRRRGGLEDPDARQEARLIPGNQPPVRKEDKLASPGWMLPEDLCAKKTEVPWGKGRKSCQSMSALPRKGGPPHLTPLRRILGQEEATSPTKKNPEGFSRQNPSNPKGAPVGSS